MSEERAGKTRLALSMAGVAAVSYISSFILGQSLNLPFEPLIRIVLFTLILLGFQKIRNTKFRNREIISLTIFSFLLVISIILGNHIHVRNAYNGLLTDNYITNYSTADLIAFPFMFIGIDVLVIALYALLRNHQHENPYYDNALIQRIPVKSIALISAIIFVAWIPYLLIYYPGFIFGDSINSISQALGRSALNNHFPIMYTVFIKICLKIGRFFTGVDNTIGCAISSIAQMLYMALCFGYMICWICKRGHFRSVWKIALIVIYGLTPYIATYSVAMWKDPIFSITLMVVTLELVDLVLSNGKTFHDKKMWIPEYIILLLIIIFSRNNGIYIILFTEVILAVVWFVYCKRKSHNIWRNIVAITAAVLIVSQIITGPIYDYLKIVEEPVEGMGIFLNQMARVAAYNGNMSESDREYMGKLLPIELYPSTYRPSCTDLLKWDSHFNASALNSDFYKHWISMFVKNPREYFEAWELETYGFWTVNRPEITASSWNISAGVPRNTSDGMVQLQKYQIKASNLLKNESLKKFFPEDEWSVPIGIIGWCLLFMVVYLSLNHRKKFLLTLAPSIGLLLTLVISSPIYYWPRYGAAVQFLIPVYLLLFTL